MATAYKADNYAQPFTASPFAGIEMVRDFLFTVSVAFVINDTVKLVAMKAGSGLILDGFYIDLPDLDTNGTPTWKADLGDTDTAAKFVSASTLGQAPALLIPGCTGFVAASLPVKYTADKDFILKCNTAPATGATSVSIRGSIRYHNIGSATVL